MPGSQFKARIDYVSAAIDPATRRLLVRATIDNKDGLFKPEMFANVTIYSGGDHPSVGVPKQALIYEGEHVRLWVAHDDKSIELRNSRNRPDQWRSCRGPNQPEGRRENRHQRQSVHRSGGLRQLIRLKSFSNQIRIEWTVSLPLLSVADS